MLESRLRSVCEPWLLEFDGGRTGVEMVYKSAGMICKSAGSGSNCRCCTSNMDHEEEEEGGRRRLFFQRNNYQWQRQPLQQERWST